MATENAPAMTLEAVRSVIRFLLWGNGKFPWLHDPVGPCPERAMVAPGNALFRHLRKQRKGYR